MKRFFLMPFCIVILCVVYFFLNANDFEHTEPSVSLYLVKDKGNYQLNSHFNPKNDIKLSAFDSSGIASYSIRIIDSNNKTLLEKNEILTKKNKNIDVILPKIQNLKNGDSITYDIAVQDWSNANFFNGNKSRITKKLVIDNVSPKIQIIATSEQISYGGSVLIAFQVSDMLTNHTNSANPVSPRNIESENRESRDSKNDIDRVLISNGKNIFHAYPYVNKQGYLIYLALIAWPIANTSFDGKIYAYDKANNEQVALIPITTNINFARAKYNFILSDSYINKTISLLEQNIIFPNIYESNIEKFMYFNKTTRFQDNKKITGFNSIHNNMLEKLPRFNTFAPLGEYKISGSFGDEYIYKYGQENIGNFIRLGVDLLTPHNLAVISSNEATPIFSGTLSEYGNTILLAHALGLSTMYGYLKDLKDIEKILANKDSNKNSYTNSIEPLDVIGKVGKSGLALRDSLRFSVIVQGHFVNPKEWMNYEWIDKNINQVLERADRFGFK